jgi:hypothetical protein
MQTPSTLPSNQPMHRLRNPTLRTQKASQCMSDGQNCIYNWLGTGCSGIIQSVYAKGAKHAVLVFVSKRFPGNWIFPRSIGWASNLPWRCLYQTACQIALCDVVLAPTDEHGRQAIRDPDKVQMQMYGLISYISRQFQIDLYYWFTYDVVLESSEVWEILESLVICLLTKKFKRYDSFWSIR